MYQYVEDKDLLNEAKNFSNQIMKKLNDKIADFQIKTYLVGSGKRNMVTKNGDGPFDLDYNLEIKNGLEYNTQNLRALKNQIIKQLISILDNNKYKVEDSKSAITIKQRDSFYASIHIPKHQKGYFQIDLCIVTRDKSQNLHRLIHKKTGFTNLDEYIWNEVRAAKNCNKKIALIKKARKWNDVRREYLKLKNIFLTNQDHNRPSFVIFYEAVNNVYNQLKTKKEL